MTDLYAPALFGKRMINDNYNGDYVKRTEFLSRVDDLRKQNAELAKERDKYLNILTNGDKQIQKELSLLRAENNKMRHYKRIVHSIITAMASTNNREIKEKVFKDIYGINDTANWARVTISTDAFPEVEQRGEGDRYE